VFGTSDDIDADFAQDIFNTFEGFVGTEDTAGRSVFGLSTAQQRPSRAAAATIGDTVTRADGTGARNVSVELYASDVSGRVGKRLDDTETDRSGVYRFRPDPGCYVVRFKAPGRSTFVGGGRQLDWAVCALEGEVNNTIDAVLSS
jgi:hypothetical protein